MNHFATNKSVSGSPLLYCQPCRTLNDGPSGLPVEGKCVEAVRMSDSDTIVLLDRTRIRLRGIDAPERDQR